MQLRDLIGERITECFMQGLRQGFREMLMGICAQSWLLRALHTPTCSSTSAGRSHKTIGCCLRPKEWTSFQPRRWP